MVFQQFVGFLSIYEAIISLANAILIILIILQYRHSKRPLLKTKIISSSKDIGEKPEVRESIYTDESGIPDTLYFVVSNKSENITENLIINFQYEIESKSSKREIKKTEELSYLNPKESAKIPLPLRSIIKQNPDLFQRWYKDGGEIKKLEETEKRSHKTLPKENLIIKLTVIIKNKLGNIPFNYKWKDEYELDWKKFDKETDGRRTFNKLPIIDSVHLRNDFTIHRTE